MNLQILSSGYSSWILLVALLMGVMVGSQGRYDNSPYANCPDLMELTPRTFDSNVLHSDEIWVILFYATWCPYCKALIPEWKKTAENLKGKMRIGEVDVPKNSDIRRRVWVKGYPTMMMFGVNKKEPITYYGPRTAPKMTDRFLSFAESERTKKNSFFQQEI